MTKPKPSIEHRVDSLLEHGIENPKKWAAVHGYKEPEIDATWTELDHHHEWVRLREHHLEETNFLFSMLDTMRNRILALEKRNEELEKRWANRGPEVSPYDDNYYGRSIW